MAFRSAVARLAEGDAEAASAAATEAKRLAPRAAPIREILGIALYRAGAYRTALSELLAYRRMTGRVDQNHLIADAYRAAGSPEKAIPLIDDALATSLPRETRAEAVVVGASALADMGRFQEALSLLRRFPTRAEVGAEPDLRVWYVTADVLARSGRPSEAATFLRLVVRFDPDAFDAAERLLDLDR